MAQDAGFRAECFDLARDTVGDCEDRPLAGYNHMQAALLASQAAAGELSTAELHDASIRLFNRHALEAFASEYAYRVGWGKESIEFALHMETHLRDRLALPPSADMAIVLAAIDDDDTEGITDAVLQRAVAHVKALHPKAGSHCLPAFLAGQGGVEFNAWMEHLRSKFPQNFEKLNRQVGDRLEARTRKLGGTAEAREQAGVECKELYARLSTRMVARLTRQALREARGDLDAGAGPGRRGLAQRLAAGLRKVLPGFLPRRHRRD